MKSNKSINNKAVENPVVINKGGSCTKKMIGIIELIPMVIKV